VLDNLERALEHASSDPEHIIEGVRAAHQQALSYSQTSAFRGATT
jgi:molecular chaperone GrpE